MGMYAVAHYHAKSGEQRRSRQITYLTNQGHEVAVESIAKQNLRFKY